MVYTIREVVYSHRFLFLVRILRLLDILIHSRNPVLGLVQVASDGIHVILQICQRSIGISQVSSDGIDVII